MSKRMKKQELKTILDTYREAENQVRLLDMDFGICLYNSNKESFYHNYNYIIRKLFEQIFTNEQCDLIETFLFEECDLTFEGLCDRLEIYE